MQKKPLSKNSKLTTLSKQKSVAKNTSKKESSVNKVKQAKVLPVSTNKIKVQNKSKQEKKPLIIIPAKKVITPRKKPQVSSIKEPTTKIKEKTKSEKIKPIGDIVHSSPAKKESKVKQRFTSKLTEDDILNKLLIKTEPKVKQRFTSTLTEDDILFEEYKENKKDNKETSIAENLLKIKNIRIKFAADYVELCESLGEAATSTELENLKKCHIGPALIYKHAEDYTIYEVLLNNLNATLQRIAKLFDLEPAFIFQQIRKVFNEQFNIEVAKAVCNYLVTSLPTIRTDGYGGPDDYAVSQHDMPPLILKNIHRTQTLEKYESFIKLVHNVDLPCTLENSFDKSNKVKNWKLLKPDKDYAELNMLSIVLINIYLLGFYKIKL